MTWSPPVVRESRVGDLNDLWRGYVCARATALIDDGSED